MKTNLSINQTIHPGYLLSPEEIKMVENFYGVNGGKSGTVNFEIPSIKKPIRKLILSAFSVVLAAITTPFIFRESEAVVPVENAFSYKDTKRHIYELEAKVQENGENLTGLTSVVTFLVETAKGNLSNETTLAPFSPQISESDESKPRLAVVLRDKTPLKVSNQKNAKTLILVGKDSRLVVAEIKGDWVKVASPKGGKAWIQKDALNIL